MYFNKVETTSNFVFDAPETGAIRVVDHGSNVFRVQVPSKRWPRGSDSFAWMDPSAFAAHRSEASLAVMADGGLHLSLDGQSLLKSQPGRGFGVCGTKWLFAFPWNSRDRFYGMGQKTLGLELSGVRTQFWNTDVFADFHMDLIEKAGPDPMYASFPVLIMKTRGCWVAMVVNNPHAVFMNTGAKEGIFQPGAGPFVPELFLGSRDGEPDVWIMASREPADLVRKIQGLQGHAALPPLWALGHQQCRWGYKSAEDLERIASEYERRGIPNDGLWLDIDYMNGFRVFTVDRTHFPDPEATIAGLRKRGFAVVPILDPGLRQDPAYEVYARAKEADVLCKTGEGADFVGYVWPGYTVFPDFSMAGGREFWAREVEEFTRLGFSGYWIDMNDPSTGSVPLDDMRFQNGSLPHSAWHNQYALGMAVATDEGQRRARPGMRPFTISRSQFLGAARHTALWTGDNISNKAHMKGSIPMSLNLSVSGMPFNGPDVPGFCGDASAELMRAWYKLGFLFPFLRNHSIAGSRDQEPWTRDSETERIVGNYIRLRYKLLPYLYQLFVNQTLHGEPILRPLWYHDPSEAFERVDDQFFVGHAILQAPFVDPEATERTVLLPVHQNGTSWYDLMSGTFRSSGTSHKHQAHPDTTPLYLASPSIIPLQEGNVRTNAKNLARLEVLLVCEAGSRMVWTYQLDDGESLAWQAGKRSVYECELQGDGAAGGLAVRLDCKRLQDGMGGIELSFLIIAPETVQSFTLNGKTQVLSDADFVAAGTLTKVKRSPWTKV